MTRLTSSWGFAFLTLAASQLVSNCGMDAAQTNKPVVTASASDHTTTVSPSTQPVVAGGVADYASGATAMAATTDANMRPASTAAFTSAEATDYRISQQDVLQISVFQIKDLDSAVQVVQDGNITLPLIGSVQVAGRTTPETEQLIAG